MPHQIWSGSISFGLVTIPIKLYPATDDKSFSFNQLCPKGHRIKYKRWCPVEEKDSLLGIKKGYEIEKDNYVVVITNEGHRPSSQEIRPTDSSVIIKSYL